VIVPGHILLYCSSCKYYKIKDVLLFQDIYFCTAAPANITKSRICDCSRTYPSVLQLLKILQNQGCEIVPGHILLYCSSCKYYKIKDL